MEGLGLQGSGSPLHYSRQVTHKLIIYAESDRVLLNMPRELSTFQSSERVNIQLLLRCSTKCEDLHDASIRTGSTKPFTKQHSVPQVPVTAASGEASKLGNIGLRACKVDYSSGITEQHLQHRKTTTYKSNP